MSLFVSEGWETKHKIVQNKSLHIMRSDGRWVMSQKEGSFLPGPDAICNAALAPLEQNLTGHMQGTHAHGTA